MDYNAGRRLGCAFRLLLFHITLQAAGAGGKEVNLLDTATAQAGLGWLPDPADTGWSEFQQMMNGTPTYMYQDCNVLSSDTDHWLRSNWIYRGDTARIFVEQKFTVRDCKSFANEQVACKETFNLYYMESDQDHGIFFRRGLFTKVNTIAADQSFTSKDISSGALHLNVEVSTIAPLTGKGFYLAFQNFGACVALVAVRVFYKVCPEVVSGLARFPETLAGAEGLAEVAGTCVEYAQEDGVPRMHCSADGEWLVPVGQCQCLSGFEEAGSGGECMACQQGFYKDSPETPRCLKCPPNSSSGSPGATACICNAGFYRAPTEGLATSCTRPPSAPRNASYSIQGTVASLRWLPPNDPGGRQDLTYSISCEKCPLEAGSCEPCEASVGYTPSADSLLVPAVTVNGLEPYCNYTFTVEARNGVSELAHMTRGTTRVQVTIGHVAPVTVSTLRLVEQGVHSLSVSWVGPQQRTRTPLQYEVTFYPKGEENQFHVKRLQESNLELTDLQPDTAYLIRVQTLTPLGPGPISPLQEFRTLSPGPQGLSAGGVVGIVMGVLLCIAVLALFLYIRNSRRSRRRRSGPGYSSTGSDREEKVLLKPYVDLQAYQDPSQAFQQFTKEIDPAYINTESVIGEGEFGEVFSGSLRLPGKERVTVAIKTLKTTYSDSQWWNFLREATIMGQFSHPNIVHLEGVVTKQKPMMIITEFMENGALDAFLRQNEDKFSCTQLVGMLQGIAAGMRYLSDRHYVHRDLAARNILVTRSLLCKVSDFGLSRILENDTEGTYETRGGKIPIRWTAPEAIALRIFTSASDVWSFGIVMWEVLCYGDKPYGDMSNQEVMKSIEDGYRLPPPVDAPSILYDLMKKCWAHDRTKRPTFREIQAELDHLVGNPHCLRNIADFDPRVTLRLPSCSGSDGIPYRTISEWLESIRMKRYIINFRSAGLDVIESVLDLTTEDLKQMGITLPGHQKRILCSIQGFQE